MRTDVSFKNSSSFLRILPIEKREKIEDMAAAPLSQRQEDGLLVLKARRSEEENLQPLTKLAMRSVARNFKLFASLDRPFEDLPRSVLVDMLSYEPLTRLLQCPKYAHLMITKHAGSVILDFGPYEPTSGTFVTWTESDVEKVCARIEESSANLRKLVINPNRVAWYISRKIKRKSPQLSTARLHELLRHLPRLNTFQCDLADNCTEGDCGVTHDTLKVLATNCPKLRFLMVLGPPYCGSSSAITTKDVAELCAACPELEVLDIPLPHCVRWSESLKFLLPLVPRLWRLHFSRPWPLQTLEPCELLSYIEHRGATHPQLRYSLRLPQEVKGFDTIATSFPRCQNLCVQHGSNPDLTPALNFKELRKLTLLRIKGNNVVLREIFHDLLAQRSFKFIWLARIENFSLDLSLFAHLCPELETLGVVGLEISKKPQYQIKPYHFRSLKNMFLTRLTLPPAALPVVAKMFASPNLVELHLYNVSVPDVLFSNLAMEAREHRQVFSALEELDIRLCRVSPETLMDVLLQAPRLRQLTLSEEDKEHYKSVVAFVSEHLQHVTLK